jgi:hypothetical protein
MESGFEDNRVPMDEIIELLYLSRVYLFWIMKISPASSLDQGQFLQRCILKCGL